MATREIDKIKNALKEEVIDRDEIIDYILAAILAKEHVFILGPPGTAKSLIFERISEMIDLTLFHQAMDGNKRPEEVFGPVSASAYANDEYRRITEGYMPSAEIVFADEGFRAPSAVLEGMHTIMNERRYVNGNQIVDTPLVSMFIAANSTPYQVELQAFYDRILFRLNAEYLQGRHLEELLTRGRKRKDSGYSVKQDDFKPKEVLKVDYNKMREEYEEHLEHATISPEVISSMKKIAHELRTARNPVRVSDRRIRQATNAFGAISYVKGYNHVSAYRLGDIIPALWSHKDDIKTVETVVSRHYPTSVQLYASAKEFFVDTMGKYESNFLPSSDQEMKECSKQFAKLETEIEEAIRYLEVDNMTHEVKEMNTYREEQSKRIKKIYKEHMSNS